MGIDIMIKQDGITVAHNSARSTTTLTDINHRRAFELTHGGAPTNPDNAERAMYRAYVLGGTIGLLGCYGAENIRDFR
jgi:hypothetical protein